MTADDLRLIAAHGEAVRAEAGPRGPVALVGIRPGAYELAKLYQTLADIPNLPVLRVFKTREEADQGCGGRWGRRETAVRKTFRRGRDPGHMTEDIDAFGGLARIQGNKRHEKLP